MKVLLNLFVVFCVVFSFSTQAFAITNKELNILHLEVPLFFGELDTGSSRCVVGVDPSLDGDELEGHRLPAVRGGAGIEEAINEEGRVASTGGKVAFSEYASLGQEYRDYYITMRWRYRIWAWNGISRSGPETVSWYKQSEPRKVLVTNPATGKSIIAAVLEAGPAPWTGTPGGSSTANNPPSYWLDFVNGTPAEFDGRVAGFPPAAVEALSMQQWMYGGPNSAHPNGGGHELLYAWAPDQNARPGPTDLSIGDGLDSDGNPVCNPGGTGVGPDGFVFPLVTSQADIRNGYQGSVWCYENLNNCHHNYNAADIFVEPGTVAVASRPGTVVRAVNQIGGIGARIVVKGDDGHVYYYTHLTNGSVNQLKGDRVAAGETIGTVGTTQQAAGTTPHLHFDMLPPSYSYRPSCSGAACRNHPFINVQPILTTAFKALPE